jgi:hypothetical protein
VGKIKICKDIAMHNSRYKKWNYLLGTLLVMLPSMAVTLSAQPESAKVQAPLVLPSDPHIVLLGRCDLRDPNQPRFGYPGITIKIRFTGSLLSARFLNNTENNAIDVIIDGTDPVVYHLPKGTSEIELARGLETGVHQAEIVKRTETWQGIITFLGLRLAQEGMLLDPPPLSRRKLMFIGDSVTCGSGVDNSPGCKEGKFNPSDGYASYGMVLGRELDAQVHLVCYGGRGLVRDYRGKRDILNAPQFFDVSIPADDPVERAGWSHDLWIPDAVVVSLGTNDFNLDKDDPIKEEEFVNAYVNFVHAILAHYPKALIFLTEGAIVNDESNPSRRPLTVLRGFIKKAVETLNHPQVQWVESRHYPGFDCDAHPTRAQHLRMAQDFEPVLRSALGW